MSSPTTGINSNARNHMTTPQGHSWCPIQCPVRSLKYWVTYIHRRQYAHRRLTSDAKSFLLVRGGVGVLSWDAHAAPPWPTVALLRRVPSGFLSFAQSFSHGNMYTPSFVCFDTVTLFSPTFWSPSDHPKRLILLSKWLKDNWVRCGQHHSTK